MDAVKLVVIIILVAVGLSVFVTALSLVPTGGELGRESWNALRQQPVTSSGAEVGYSPWKMVRLVAAQVLPGGFMVIAEVVAAGAVFMGVVMGYRLIRGWLS